MARPPPTNSSKFSALIVEDATDTTFLPTTLPTDNLDCLPYCGNPSRRITSPVL